MAETMNMLMINKSGQTYVVRDEITNEIKGRIYNREVFALGQGGDRYQELVFLNSSGNLTSVWVDDIKNPIPDGFFSPCTLYPYSEEVIRDERLYIYKMRKTMNVYTAAGNYWGKVATGMYVATANETVGENHKDWKLIHYVKSAKGKWVKVTGDGYNHGFVDTGLSRASGYDSIAFYGSW